MYVNKEDKNIFIMILAIFAVSIIALIAIGNIIWRIVSPGINAGIAEIGNFIRINQLDYNFEIPEKREPIVAQPVIPAEPVLTDEEQKVKEMNLNYNFAIPSKNGSQVVLGISNFYEEITQDYKLGDVKNTKVNGTLRVSIPKISFSSQVFQGNDATRLMQNGMWLHQSSSAFGQGELAVLCTRRNFDNNDPRSCYYMDLVKVNDQVIVSFNDMAFDYKVTKIELFESNYQAIYTNLKADKNTVKIITSGHVDSGKGRLVITAERI